MRFCGKCRGVLLNTHTIVLPDENVNAEEWQCSLSKSLFIFWTKYAEAVAYTAQTGMHTCCLTFMCISEALSCFVQAVWSVEQAEKAVQEFAAGASKAMLFMRHLSAVALWRWPEDSTSPAPLHHVRSCACSTLSSMELQSLPATCILQV